MHKMPEARSKQLTAFVSIATVDNVRTLTCFLRTWTARKVKAHMLLRGWYRSHSTIITTGTWSMKHCLSFCMHVQDIVLSCGVEAVAAAQVRDDGLIMRAATWPQRRVTARRHIQRWYLNHNAYTVAIATVYAL